MWNICEGFNKFVAEWINNKERGCSFGASSLYLLSKFVLIQFLPSTRRAVITAQALSAVTFNIVAGGSMIVLILCDNWQCFWREAI